MKKRFRRDRNRLLSKHKFNLIIIFILLLIISTGYSLLGENLIASGKIFISNKNENPYIYKDETVSAYGLTFELTSDGYLTINGKQDGSSNLYVRVNNSISIATVGNVATELFNDETLLIPAGSTIENGYQYISGTATPGNGELNLCIRDAADQAVLRAPLISSDNSKIDILENNAIAQYVYISAKSYFDNYKIKLNCKVIEKTGEIETLKDHFQLQNGVQDFRGVNIDVTGATGQIKLNGKATASLFIKISDGVEATIDSAKFIRWNEDATTLISAGRKINLSYEYVSGTITGANSNICLRNVTNGCEHKFKLEYLNTPNTDVIDTEGKTLTINSKVLYIYIASGTVLDNYTIISKINYSSNGISELYEEVENTNTTVSNEVTNGVTNVVSNEVNNETSTNEQVETNTTNVVENTTVSNEVVSETNTTTSNTIIENQNVVNEV